MMEEAGQHLLGRLADPELRALALLKLEGYTHAELVPRLGYSERTLRRMILVIRRCWESQTS
jgi:DNA-directed RNA polymerase specialized sigma24 family protein